MSEAAWKERFGQTIMELLDAKLLEKITDKKSRLTTAGREAALEFLDVRNLPAVLWTTLKNRYLLAKALSINPSNACILKEVSTADGCRAAVLRLRFELPESDEGISDVV